MTRFKYIIINIILALGTLFVCSNHVGAREEISLCGTWQFALERDHSSFDSWTEGFGFGRNVEVPHTWNVEVKTERIFGRAWYERYVEVPQAWKGKQVCICFEAVYRDADVWVNGKKVGSHYGSGFTEFSFDISKYLVYGDENLITVSVDNSFSENALPYKAKFDWPNDGGIIRPVRLLALDNPAVRSTKVRYDINCQSRSADVDIEVASWNTSIKQATYALRIKEWKSNHEVYSNEFNVKVVSGVSHLSFHLDSVNLWHFDHPNLYVVELESVKNGKSVDSYSTRFGFRKVEIRGDSLYLNDEAMRLPGIEYMPGSYPDYGMAEPLWVMEKAVEQIKELNCVLTRCHWQYDKRYFDLLDEKGILTQEEIPWWQAPGNLSPELEALARSQIDEMLERDFNHPSIIAWGVSNEVFYNTDKDIYRRLIKHAKDYDSGRFVTVVSNEIFDRLENDESLLGDIPTWNDYTGTWHGKSREETPGKLALINERALKGRPLLITEHGLCEPRFVGADSRRIVEMTYHYDQWAKNKYIIGAIYFSLNDYRTHVGEAGFGRYKSRVHGLSSMWFDKKPSFEAYRGLASPIYVENLHINADGTRAQVVVRVKNDLPSYSLRGYKVVWGTVKAGKSIILPDLKPGEKYTFNINELNPAVRPDVRIYRPTGYLVTEY
ncbi:MAG: glycoside hydrolase family 2 protein [Muribaculaceae bacterium]